MFRSPVSRLRALPLFVVLVSIPVLSFAWTTPVPLNSTASSDSKNDVNPDIAATTPGNWVSVWMTNQESLGGESLRYGIATARSGGGSQVWQAASSLHPEARGNTGHHVRPEVAADSIGHCVAVWIRIPTSDGLLGRVLFSRSADGGASWTAPSPLDGGSEDADYRTDISTDRNGVWIASWSTAAGVRYSRSIDAGATWSSPLFLNNNSSVGGIPDVQNDGRGTWIISWTIANTDNDVVYVRSTDHGKTWTSPAYLNVGGGSDLTHEYDTQLATDGNNNWVAVWNAYERGIGYATSSNNGVSWSSPTIFATTFNGNMTPALATDKNGHWIVIWEQLLTSSRGVLFWAGSSDLGATWSVPQYFGDTNLRSTGIAYAPELVTNGYGEWRAAWNTDYLPGQGAVSDYDIQTSIHYIGTDPKSQISNRQLLRVLSNGGGYQELVYNYTTESTDITPYEWTNKGVPFNLPQNQWFGAYHYDYVAGAFTTGFFGTLDR